MREQVAALTRPAVGRCSHHAGLRRRIHRYVYIAPQVTEVTGFGCDSPCCCYSVRLTVGNALDGKLADRAVMPTVLGSLTLLALVLFGMTSPSRTE